MNSLPVGQPGAHQVLTGPGPAAIAVLRLLGPAAEVFLRRHVRPAGPASSATAASPRPGALYRGELLDDTGEAIDDILVSIHAGPPDWDIRLHLHGNPWLVNRAGALATACGLPGPAETPGGLWAATDAIEADVLGLLPGALTLRGARWLASQRERLREELCALADSRTPVEQARERIRQLIARTAIWDAFCRPLRAVLTGPPNAGKSTLVNALTGRQVSLVAPTAGVTRDWVESPGEIDGFPILWIDTAGLADSNSPLDAAGMASALQAIARSDFAVVVLDATAEAAATRRAYLENVKLPDKRLVVLNKCDAAGTVEREAALRELAERVSAPALAVSAVTGEGLEALCASVRGGALPRDQEIEAPAAVPGRTLATLRRALKLRPGSMRRALVRLLDSPK